MEDINKEKNLEKALKGDKFFRELSAKKIIRENLSTDFCNGSEKAIVSIDKIVEWMEKYANQFKIDLREELIKFLKIYEGKSFDIPNHDIAIQMKIDEYLKQR